MAGLHTARRFRTGFLIINSGGKSMSPRFIVQRTAEASLSPPLYSSYGSTLANTSLIPFFPHRLSLRIQSFNSTILPLLDSSELDLDYSRISDMVPITENETESNPNFSKPMEPQEPAALSLSIPNSPPNSNETPVRVFEVQDGLVSGMYVSGSDSEQGFLNFRSGKGVRKRELDLDLNLNDDYEFENPRQVRKGDEELMGELLSTSVDVVELDLVSALAGDRIDAELAFQSGLMNSGDVQNSDVNHVADNAALQNQQQIMDLRRRHYISRRNENMENFRNIAKKNASRFAHFSADDGDDMSSADAQLEDEDEDSEGPFSAAMKMIKDREIRSYQIGGVSSEKSSPPPITWVPRMGQAERGSAKVSVPSLRELCLNILAENADAIVSLDGVPDALRHKLSQLLCDSRKMNCHFFELLVSGCPTEIRLRDCSWLTEDQFTKSFETCDTTNLEVLQLDQCGRCLPDYVLLASLAQSARRLPRLASLSLSGACRLSDGGVRALVSSAPVLESLNLSQCSLITSASIEVLADSLGSLLKELYLDDCVGIDALLIVPALVKLEQLQVLSVAGIQTVCDEFIKNYIIACGHNMKELVLRDCVKLTDSSMKVIARHCPGLCSLDLVNLSKLTDSSIKYLTNGCLSLHTLKLCRNAFSDEAISAFAENSAVFLRELSLNNVKKVGNHTALSLARHAKSLHTLDLSWCRNLTDNAVGLIVDSCLSLRLLKLFGCSQITDVFLSGHSNPEIQIIGLKMSPLLQHVKVPNPEEGALHYSSAPSYI